MTKYYSIRGTPAVVVFPNGGNKGFSIYEDGVRGCDYNLKTDQERIGLTRITSVQAEHIVTRRVLRNNRNFRQKFYY